MSIFKKLFGGKTPPPAPSAKPPVERKTDPPKDQNLIRVFDNYGREVSITRDQWREKVLPDNLKAVWDKPDDLYNMIIGALNDGFRPEIVEASKHLHQIDPDKVRGACIWGLVLMEEDRLDEAEAVFRQVTLQAGEQGVIFTNWAKVYAKRKDDAKADELLWHALELDPNQNNGVAWYEVIYREKGGTEAGQEALRRIAALPGSWRAMLWLARHALDNRQLERAISLYEESLSCAPRPVPSDLLMQMSGDLGNHAHLPEILQMCEPHFDPAFHGIQVGNNLIKAHVDLGQFEAAKSILNTLYAQKRPDWQKNLNFWDNAIAKASVEITNPPPEKMQVGISILNDPIWLRKDSPALTLFEKKAEDGPVVAFLGSSVTTGATESKRGLSDAAGRISRALPLFLAEQIQMTSSGLTKVLTPWISSGGTGFVVMGVPSQGDHVCNLARQGEPVADYLVNLHITAKEEPWNIEMTVYRTIDQATLGSAKASFTSAQPETAFAYLVEQLKQLLLRETEIEATVNPLYQIPKGPEFPYYLLRLEQALAVSFSQMDHGEDFLSGEREIIDGNIQLNLNNPQNVVTRLLLAQTLRQMKKVRPDILAEFRDKVALLQREKPVPQPAQNVIQGILDEVFGG